MAAHPCPCCGARRRTRKHSAAQHHGLAAVRRTRTRRPHRTHARSVRRHRSGPATGVAGMNTLLVLVPILTPLLAAVLTGIVGWRRLTAWVTVAAAACILAGGVGLVPRIGH